MTSLSISTPLSSIPSLYPLVEGQFVSAQLCHPMNSIQEAQEFIHQHNYIIENKYDGIRIQLHRKGDEFTVFGRSGEVGDCCK